MNPPFKQAFFMTAVYTVLSLAFTGCMNPGKADIPKKSDPAAGWKVIGPGGGGGLFDPTIDPADPDHVMMRCDMTAGYVTRDGGKQWDIYNLWTVITDFEFVPREPGTVYASTRGYLHDEDRGSGLSMLCRSRDGGTKWEIVYPSLHAHPKLMSFKNLQSLSLTPSEMDSTLPDCSIDKICVDPSNPGHIYLGMSPLLPYIGPPETPAHGGAIVMASEDSGESWHVLTSLPGKKVLAIIPVPGVSELNHLVVITEKAAVTVDPADGKTSVHPLPVDLAQSAEGGTGEKGTRIYLLAGTRYTNGKLSGGLFKSDDGGKSWQSLNEAVIDVRPGERIRNFQSIGVCQGAPENIYLAGNTIIPGTNGESPVYHEVIYRSHDGGASWKTVYLSDTRNVLSGNFKGSWLNNDYGPGWGGVPISMGVSPHDPDICYGTDYGRAYCTKDGGSTWQQVYSTNHPDGSYTGTGLDVTCCYGLHFDPFDTCTPRDFLYRCGPVPEL